MIGLSTQLVPPASPAKPDRSLREAAHRLEAAFLSEMLKSAGFGAARTGLGSGGVGEQQFTSYLRELQAEKMVEAGGIGLAETLFHALKETQA